MTLSVSLQLKQYVFLEDKLEGLFFELESQQTPCNA